ncbi:MAG: hypothetical protein CVT61_01890 [Actinobacteria bacterium HGW-Actinobacteria-11]|nr:MAG: hypothetical protein CVT61_01890 [Actinobacteria bacterium HGW-Actinobacteria-11]
MSVSSAPAPDTAMVRGVQSNPRQSVRTSAGRILRILLAAAFIAGAVALAMQADQFRHVEAWMAALWMNPLIEGGVVASNDSFMLWVADDHLVAFRVTAECTAVILLVPQLILGGGLLLSRRIRIGRGLAGIGVMVALVMIVNQLRLGLIGWATQQGGLEAGYEISHRYVGSAIGIAGFVIALVVMLLVMGLRARRRR